MTALPSDGAKVYIQQPLSLLIMSRGRRGEEREKKINSLTRRNREHTFGHNNRLHSAAQKQSLSPLYNIKPYRFYRLLLSRVNK